MKRNNRIVLLFKFRFYLNFKALYKFFIGVMKPMLKKCCRETKIGNYWIINAYRVEITCVSQRHVMLFRKGDNKSIKKLLI